MINKHLSRIAGLASFNTRAVTAAVAVSAALLSGLVTDADAGQLNVNVSARGNQRSTWQDAFDKFKKANPDVDLKITYITEEAYKVQMGGWLATDPPDVVSWHDGERMAYYAKRGLLEDLSGDWTKNGWSQQYASVKEASTYNGKQYAAPLGYDAYGFFYRKDLFEKAGIKSEPKTWEEFLDACKKLRQAASHPSPSLRATAGRLPHGSITSICASTAMRSIRS